MLLVTVHWLL